MKLKKILMLGLVCLSVIGMVGCGENKTADNTNTDTQKQEQKKAPDEIDGVSLKNPIKLDMKTKTITVLCKVDGKYFHQPTRHASVFKDGTNGSKTIFVAYGKPKEFYEDLIKLGAKPGDNMTPENAAKTKVEGTPIKMKVTWPGAPKVYDINEVVNDSNGNKIEFKFGGNLKRSQKMNTGCLSCLDSCPVGIISNSVYTNGAVEKRHEVAFTGKEDVLPKDGTYVVTIYSLAE